MGGKHTLVAELMGDRLQVDQSTGHQRPSGSASQPYRIRAPPPQTAFSADPLDANAGAPQEGGGVQHIDYTMLVFTPQQQA
jgi:hypothetical protein